MESAIVCVLIGLIAIDLILHLTFALIVLPTFERKPLFGVQPATPDGRAERITIPTSHGLSLRGSLYRQESRPARGLILFCPELGGNHWSAGNYCEGLMDAGFDVLSFDFRSQGESDRMPGYEPLHWLTDFEVRDVLAAINYARQHEELRDLPMGLLGISRGAGAALAAVARCRGIHLVAGEGVYSTDSLLTHYALRWATLYVPGWLLALLPLWHLHATLGVTRWLSQLRRRCQYTDLESLLPRLADKRVFMIAGGRDTYVAPEITETLSRRIDPDGPGVWIVPEAKHNMARSVDPDEYDRKLVGFFSQLAARTPSGAIHQPQL